MINTKLELLFPKPLYIVENLCTEYLPEFEKTAHEIIRNGYNRFDEFQVNTTNQVNNNVLDSFPQLKTSILDYSKKFMQELNYDSSYIDNAAMIDSFLNISYGGDYLFPHTHGICLLSGVFYIKAPADSKIWLYDDLHKVERHYTSSIPSTSQNSVSYDCLPGRLLIFQPDLIHGNKAQPEGEKIAISFKIN